MRKSRKICCRITPRRILGAVLIAASTVNLIIVGTAFELSFPDDVSTTTATTTTAYSITRTFSAPTATNGVMATDTPTPTLTFTPTATFTATYTETPSPTPTQCVPRYDWPVYIVVDGDTLSRLAATTGVSYYELMAANCLPNTVIYVGQRLYVPRLPATPTNTTPPNIPTVFGESSVSCPYTFGVDFAVAAYDPEGISALSVTYWVMTVNCEIPSR